MAIETSVDNGVVSLLIAAGALAWSVITGRRPMKRESDEEAAKKLASSIRSDEVVKSAVEDVSLARAENSEKFVGTKEFAMELRQLRKDVRTHANIARSNDRKLDALLGAARIQIREVPIEVQVEADPDDFV